MITTIQQSNLSLLAVYADEFETVVAPSLDVLIEKLEDVRLGRISCRSVACAIRLMDEIDGELIFLRVQDPREGSFRGWIVQLCSAEEFHSFALAYVGQQHSHRMETSQAIELFSCIETLDSRCILAHVDVIEWVSDELSGHTTADRFRWIDYSIVLKELA